jgi:hypothetical protein
MKVEGDISDDTLKLHVIDLLLKDVGTAGYTEYDWGTTLAEYFENNEDKWPVMFFSIHSHHNMGVTPSGVDDKHLYDNISNFPFHLSVIVNNKLDFNARIATDMVINTVSVRGMDSTYTKKEVNDGRIIVEYSLPVSICGTDTTDFQEEFDKIQAEKKAKQVPAFPNYSSYTKRTGQHEIPFANATLGTITQYTLGTLNYKISTLKEVLAEIKTDDHVDKYLDEIEKICMDYVDAGMSDKVKKAVYDLSTTFDDIAPKHKFINELSYGLSAIHSMIEDVDTFMKDYDDVPFGKSSPKHVSRMTDKEWNDYINDRRY